MKHFYKIIITALLSTFSLHALAKTPPLADAIGQMMMVGFEGTHVNTQSPIVKEIRNYHIGGVIIFQHVTTKGKKMLRNISNPQQLKMLTTELQYYAKKYSDAPLLITTNQEGGMINNLSPKNGFKVGPNLSQQKLGQLNKPKLIQQQAKQRGKLLKKYGINMNLAPVAALNINPNNPGIGKLQRSYGKSPSKVTNDLRAAIKGYHAASIFCTLKHFPGLGSAEHNTDFHASDVTKTWSPKELIPYQRLIQSQQACRFIMITHLINRRLDPSGIEASLSKKIATGLLRKKLHFKGIIITDDMDAAAIRDHVPTRKAIKLAILAGDNIILYGGTFNHNPAEDAKMLYQTMYRLAKTNAKIRAKIYQSYQRIIKIKGAIH